MSKFIAIDTHPNGQPRLTVRTPSEKGCTGNSSAPAHIVEEFIAKNPYGWLRIFNGRGVELQDLACKLRRHKIHSGTEGRADFYLINLKNPETVFAITSVPSRR